LGVAIANAPFLCGIILQNFVVLVVGGQGGGLALQLLSSEGLALVAHLGPLANGPWPVENLFLHRVMQSLHQLVADFGWRLAVR
jgi:hypothetical protein